MRPSDLRDLSFHGLLFVAPGNETHANLGAADPLSVYLQCAVLCASSFRSAGYDFTLVTNDRSALLERLGDRSAIGIVEHNFTSEVPPGAAFYSAHFKLELMRAFGAGACGDKVGLVDIDTVLLRPFSLLVPDEGLACYDITDQVVPAYGRQVVSGDVEALAGAHLPQVRWWGGEFIVGSADAFATLGRRIEQLWPRYLASMDRFHHVGDEMLTTAALNLLEHDGFPIRDCGTSGGVARWWSSRTLAPMPPLAAVSDRSLMHLPADKPFLALQSRNASFDSTRFFARYETYLRRKLLIRRGAHLLERMVGRGGGKFLPRLR